MLTDLDVRFRLVVVHLSERDRKMTILLTPFMSRTAKLPIYSFFVSAFSEEGRIYYGRSLPASVVESRRIFTTELFHEDPVPRLSRNFPLPAAGARNVGSVFVGKSKRFPAESVFIIPLCTNDNLVLQSFDLYLNLVKDSADSPSNGGGSPAPIFKPSTLGD